MLTVFPNATFSDFPVCVAISENAGFVLLLIECDLTSFTASLSHTLWVVATPYHLQSEQPFQELYENKKL